MAGDKVDALPSHKDDHQYYRPPSLLTRLSPFAKPAIPRPPSYPMSQAPMIPYATSSFFSTITFTWIYPIIHLGSRRPLEPEDLWSLPPSESSIPLAERLQEAFDRRRAIADEWNARIDGGWKPSRLVRLRETLKLTAGLDGKTMRKRATVAGMLNDVFGAQFWAAGGFKVVSDVLLVTAPLVSKRLIQYATRSYLASRGVQGYTDPGPGEGIGLAIGMFFMQSIAALSMHQFFVRSMSVGVLARGALIAAIYDRGLSLSGKARLKINAGKLVNHISTDVSRIDFCSGFFHICWTASIQLVIVIAILIVNLGASALAGIGFALAATPFQMYAMRTMFRLRQRSMVWTDKRVKLLQELLGGMKILKVFAWEKPYLEKIEGLRKEELSRLRNLHVVLAANNSIAMSVPILSSIIAFTAYSLTGNAQTSASAATIFTSLTLFNLLRMPLIMLPVSLGSIADAKNACDRLQDVFYAETIREDGSRRDGLENAVEVKGASFMWETMEGDGRGKAEKKEEERTRKKGVKREAKAAAAVASQEKAARKGKRKWFFKRSSKKVEASDDGDGDDLVEEKSSSELKAPTDSPSSGPTIEVDPTIETRQGQRPAEGIANGVGDGATAGMDAGAMDAVVKKAEIDTKDGKRAVVADREQTSKDAEPVVQLRDIDLMIPRGQLCAIVGPVGSGKSSLLQALIGQMKKLEGDVAIGGSLSYAAQTAWIQNATLRDNILFGRPFDEARYWQVVKDSCLEADLELLPDGDMTEIGEKGINLSGGQRQRVNIARAIYFDADIICLDDPLSAVDAHVGKSLFHDAIQGALADKTRILVTHALHFIPQCDYIICMDEGRITEEGTYAELVAARGAFSKLLAEYGQEEDDDDHKKDEKDELEGEAIEDAEGGKRGLIAVEREREKDDLDPEGRGEKAAKEGEVGQPAKARHQLMQTEEKAQGAVGAGVYVKYLQHANFWVMVPLLLLTLAMSQGATVLSTYTLVWWQQDEFSQPKGFYLGLYAALGVGAALLTFGMASTVVMIAVNASIRLHNKALRALLYAPLSFFDTTPLGRIMNRFSKDLDTIDNQLNDSLRMALMTFGTVLGMVVMIAIVQPYFLIAVVVIFTLYGLSGSFYRHSAREIKRLDNLLRSSLYAHFSESMSGVATIRAYGESKRFIKQNRHFIDMENRAYYLTVFNQRWLGVRLDAYGAVLILVVAIIVVATRTSTNPSQTGLILTYVLSIAQTMTWMVRQTTEVENNMNNVERLLHYGNLETEAPAEIEATKPPASWPSEGRIEFEEVTMSYRAGLPSVLKGMDLEVKGGEKVGIVGRTGAGKSSVMMALFRIVELSSGKIKIDGIDISKIGLAELRRKVAIIPQEALLFNGTIRSNLDPFGIYDDARLWDALRRSYLVERDETAGARTPSKPRFTLDTKIEDEGGNLSVGERSLVSLARALVKDSKIIVLDEATASVDFETDAKIQRTIREVEDKTLLCIAHRLRTIIAYDRVLVMDAGEVAEFDTPLALFDRGGIFQSMCSRSGITRYDIEKAHKEMISAT